MCRWKFFVSRFVPFKNLSPTFVNPRPSQILAVVIFLICAACVTLRLLPYHDRLLDIMEAVALLSNVSLALLGGAFYLKMFSSSTLTTLAIVAIVALAIVCIFLIGSVIVDASPKVGALVRVGKQNKRVARLRARRQRFSLLILKAGRGSAANKGPTVAASELNAMMRSAQQRRRWLIVFAVSKFVVPPRKRRMLQIARDVFEGFDMYISAARTGSRCDAPYAIFRNWALSLTNEEDIDVALSAMTTLRRVSRRAIDGVVQRATAMIHEAFDDAAKTTGGGGEGQVFMDGRETLQRQLAGKSDPEFEPRSLRHDVPLLRRIDKAIRMRALGSSGEVEHQRPTLAYLIDLPSDEEWLRLAPADRTIADDAYMRTEARRLKKLRDMRLAILEAVIAAAQSRLAWVIQKKDEEGRDDHVVSFLQLQPSHALEYVAFGASAARARGASQRVQCTHIAARKAFVQIMRAGDAVWTRRRASAGGGWGARISEVKDGEEEGGENRMNLAQARRDVRQVMSSTAWGWVARAMYATISVKSEERKEEKVQGERAGGGEEAKE